MGQLLDLVEKKLGARKPNPFHRTAPRQFNESQHRRDSEGKFTTSGASSPSQARRVKVHAQISHSSTKDALLLTNIKIDGAPASRNHINLRMKDFSSDASIDPRIKPGAYVVINGQHTSYVHNGQVKESLTDVTSIKLVE